MKTVAFNRSHPEMKENEFFVMNMNIDEFKNWLKIENDPCSKIEYLRLGEIAYNTFGEIVPEFKPCFAKRK